MLKKLDFLTPTMLKVLYIFHENPNEELHEREVMRRADISGGSTNKILRFLSGIGILKADKRGRMIFYSLNTESATARQIKVLFNVYALSELVNEISVDSKKIILFGSCAEGTDSRESDIDLFVLATETRRVKDKISAYELDRKISPVVLSMTEFVQLKEKDKPLYERILRGIKLWETE